MVSSSNKRSGATTTTTITVPEIKQLRVSVKTWEILTQLGEFGETYGDIVERIAKHYASCPEAVKERQQKKRKE
jgi:hypothetical protein